jgi:signal peptidase
MLKFISKFFYVMAIAILVAVVGILAFFYLDDDYSAYVVKSDSMQPTINSGDMVFIGRSNQLFVGDIAPGKIITFERHGEMVTHRVKSIVGDTIYTRGDALEDTDPWVVSRFFDVKGCYIFRIPYVGLISNFLKTKIGWFVCIILPAICLLGFIISDIVKEAKQCFLYRL